MALALCRQVEHLKEKLISQAQEVSRLRTELVRPTSRPRGPGWGAAAPAHTAPPSGGCILCQTRSPVTQPPGGRGSPKGRELNSPSLAENGSVNSVCKCDLLLSHSGK